MKCECYNWCSCDVRKMTIYGHHENCPHRNNQKIDTAGYLEMAEITGLSKDEIIKFLCKHINMLQGFIELNLKNI